MTTTIKVSAHCATDKEVEIVYGDKEKILQDGEEFDAVVYDDLCCSIREIEKDDESTDPSPESGGTGGDRPPPDND